MKKRQLSALIEISRAVGANSDFVQAGGGNTSVKSPDGRTMLVKASGTALPDVNKGAGWIELDVPRVLSLLDEPLMGLAPAEREAQVLRSMRAAVIGGPGERPSVESALHALLGPVVIHTHPTAVNALACGPGRAALDELAREGEPPPLWVPFAPGYCLAVAVREAIEAYRSKHGAAPAVFLLESHGIFVSANTADECLKLHAGWTSRCEKYFASVAPSPAPAPRPAPEEVRAAMAALRRALDEADKLPALLRLSDDPELAGAGGSEVGATLANGALSPDQVVYCGSRAIAVESLAENTPAIVTALGEPGAPRVLLAKDIGAILIADDPGGLDAAEAVASASARTIRLAAGRGGARNLDAVSVDFITHWEAESYRAGLLGAPGAPLVGRVALVTGAASGLGLGIARGLVGAGATVAFGDIDEASLKKAVDETGDAKRTLAVAMDVTDEASVARAFDRTIRNWGGVDVLVCAAGIAPPHELVNMPADEWRRALEVNLTGYFLAGREAARVMKAQGGGGSIVLLSSKTGLEASKANSAYNATKAGELHLARGWALELGPDGIRVNAVAPGNVFEGSKIWNPEYIRVCAEKRGIRPEEVIPHYVSLTAIGREIKRRDVAAAVVFLSSDAARCITGQTLVVDGGQVMVR